MADAELERVHEALQRGFAEISDKLTNADAAERERLFVELRRLTRVLDSLMLSKNLHRTAGA